MSGKLPRVGVIVLGYLAACLVVGTLLAALGLSIDMYNKPGVTRFEPRDFAESVLYGVGAVAAMAFVPALIVILRAEHAGQRSYLHYALAGLAASYFPAGLGVLWLLLTGTMFVPSLVMLLLVASVLTVMGLAGGTVYWLVAGRRAGSTTSPPPDRSS